MARKPNPKNPLREIELRVDANDVLTQEEKEVIIERARVHVLAERKKLAEEQFLDAQIEEEKRRHDPDEAMEQITIDLPGHAAFIRLDETVYFHGLSYTVRGSQGTVMREVMQRAWNHEDQTGGANRDVYRKPRNTHVGAHGVTNAPISPN